MITAKINKFNNNNLKFKGDKFAIWNSQNHRQTVAILQLLEYPLFFISL